MAANATCVVALRCVLLPLLALLASRGIDVAIAAARQGASLGSTTTIEVARRGIGGTAVAFLSSLFVHTLLPRGSWIK